MEQKSNLKFFYFSTKLNYDVEYKCACTQINVLQHFLPRNTTKSHFLHKSVHKIHLKYIHSSLKCCKNNWKIKFNKNYNFSARLTCWNTERKKTATRKYFTAFCSIIHCLCSNKLASCQKLRRKLILIYVLFLNTIKKRKKWMSQHQISDEHSIYYVVFIKVFQGNPNGAEFN